MLGNLTLFCGLKLLSLLGDTASSGRRTTSCAMEIVKVILPFLYLEKQRARVRVRGGDSQSNSPLSVP